MNILTLIIKIAIMPLFVLISLVKSVDFIYLFQIKEYRFDRFISYLKEEGHFKVFYLRHIRIPAKSVRNLLLIIITLICSLIFPIDLIYENLYALILIFLLIPILSFCFVSVGVWLTGFLATIKRNSIVDKAEDKLKHSNVTVIGITGSYGKSSVKEFLYQILSAKFKTAKTDKNMNTDVGVALSILKNLKPDTEYFIAEMGAYKIGEIQTICNLAHPRYGILTAIGNQHLGLFGSKENIERAKGELLESLPTDGRAFINAKIENKSFFQSKTKCPLTYYSSENISDISATEISQTIDGISAKITYGKHSFTIQTKLVGTHNIENLLPAIGAGIDLGISIETLQATVQELKNVEYKLSVHKGLNNSTILNDAKNSSVDGFIAAIETAASFPNKKKYILSKGIIELGDERGESYQRITAALNDVILLTTDPLFYTKSNTKENIQVFKNEHDILKFLKDTVDEHSLIVIEGRFTQVFINRIINQ